MSDVHTARIGPYRLVRRLAAGSMGVVYLGEDADGRRVALKVVRPDLAGEAEFRIRFRQEVHAALSVSGAHTAAVVGVDLGAAEPWLAVEYLDGPTLAERVALGGPLPATRVRRLLGQLAAALAAIHRAGIVHRDVKPGNVILAPGGPRVIDFGVARIPAGSDLTDDHQLLGSPGYLAPEYLRGVPAHPPGDLFALGATLLFAATGRPPFGAGPPEAVLDRAAAGEPDTDGVPPALAAVLRALLDPDPAARPAAESLVPPPRAGTGRHRARVRRTG
ncbi:MAG: serine/threonine-protein kinase, partial [Mycobacteriales bacterium]